VVEGCTSLFLWGLFYFESAPFWQVITDLTRMGLSQT
jgi:hypothetical protein